LQVRGVGRVHREPRTGRLAQGQGGAGVIDVVVREDDPIDLAQGLFLDEAKDRSEAAGIARVDDRETLAVLMKVGLRAANAWNPADHILIIAGALPSSGGEGWPNRKEGGALRVGAGVTATEPHLPLPEGRAGSDSGPG